MTTTIPPWVPPAGTLNGQSDLAKTQATIAAEHTAIPVVYGEQQVGGRIFAIKYNASSGNWTVGYLLCVGEIESIVDVYLDGAVPKSGVTVNSYTGTTSQSADSLLAAEISGYADTLVLTHPAGNLGFAYIVVQYTNTHYKAPPQCIVQVEGRKVYDPDTSTTIYSPSPALALRDLITSPHFGLGDSINDTSVLAVVADNAATVTTEARRLIGLVIDNPQETGQWIDILSAYAGCWAFKRGDVWQLVSDRPRSSDATITKADVVSGTFRLPLKDSSQVPTVVRVLYTDTSTTIWREREVIAELSGVSSGTVPLRESFVRMPGVTRRTQAMREAQERLNKLQRVLGCAFVGFDEQLARELGDVITVTHPHGVSARTFRITESPRLLAPGRVQIQAIDYDAGDYDDSESTTSYGAADQVNGTEDALPEPGATYGAPADTPIGDDGLTGDDVSATIDAPNSLNTAIAAGEGSSYRTLSKGFEVGVARDGDSVSFDPTWTNTPEVRFMAGGLIYNSSLSGDQTTDHSALGLSGSGFTARLKTKELVGSPTLRTDTTVSTPSSPSGLDKSINKDQTDEAYDDKYTFQIDVLITNQDLGGGEYNPGQVLVGFYTNDGGGWVQRATQNYIGSGSSATTARLNQTKQVTVDGLGLNDDFGVTVESSLYGGSITSFDQVTYSTATAPAEESATPTGASDVEYFVLGS